MASTVTAEMEDRDALKLETALGHKQQMQRSFGLLSLTSLGIVVAKWVFFSSSSFSFPSSLAGGFWWWLLIMWIAVLGA